VALRHPVSQSLRRHVYHLKLARRADDPIRHCLRGRDAGDLLHHVSAGIQVLDADGGDRVDSCFKQVLYILPSLGVT
jgi:hypothetical protein